MDDKNMLDRIILNPKIMVGKPVIRDTRFLKRSASGILNSAEMIDSGTERAILRIRISLDQRNLCLRIINGSKIYSLQNTKKNPNRSKASMGCIR